jgi:hypothetical protein
MSWWTYEKDKNGRTYYVSHDSAGPYFLLLILGGILFAYYFANPTGTVRVLLWTGFVCILLSKVSLFARGRWISWGPRELTIWWSRLYKLGYVLLGISVLLILAAYSLAPLGH